MRRTVGIAGVIFLLTGAFALGLGFTRAHQGGDPPSAGPPRLVDEIRRELAQGYYRTVPSAALSGKTVGDVVEALDDPYTAHLTADEYAALERRTAETYSGVGLTVRPAPNGLLVKAALQGPARAAGIRPGDRIVSINGRGVSRLSFERSLQLIGGRRGTTVKLTIRRPREGTLRFEVERGDVELAAARARMVNANGVRVGYVRVLSFRASAADAVSAFGARLVNRGAQGLVLDLRGNPGGLLSEAVGTVSLFVEDGVVCVTQGVHHGRKVYEATGRAALADVPLVVLVDGASASAAEVVAAALADHDRATVVGRKTYGKATVQSVRELSNGSALKLTTAVFLTPSGHNLTRRGLKPDVAAADRAVTRRDEALDRATTVLRRELAD